MKIAVSANCFSAFTSGFPVRGMMSALIKSNPKVRFQLYYSKRPFQTGLKAFYDEINNQPNVEVRYFDMSHKEYAVRTLLGQNNIRLDEDVDLFLNPGHVEYLKNFKGPQICLLADLSTIKGLSTVRHALFFKYWNKILLERNLPRLSRIVAVSEFTRKDINTFFPAVKTPVELIYNGINPIWFSDGDPSDISPFNIHDITKRPYFIWWGLISRRKNIFNLIKAYRKARKQNPSLPDLLLIGKIEKYMAEITAEFGDGVHNIPFQDDRTLKSLVAGSRGLVFPSLYEGFGLPVIEAFSQGINVACSNVTSLPEISGGNAILFDPEDIDDIAHAILELEKCPDRHIELKEYASKFTYSNAAEQYMNLIKTLTDNR